MARRLLWLIGGVTLVRAVLASALPLLHDEAYYWLWARRLDWSYLDHPPLIAYLIALSRLGGDSEFWVRLPALLIGPAAAYALFLLGRELFDERVGFLAVVVSLATPGLSAAGLFATPDAPMVLAWILALRFVWQALHGRPERWRTAGLAMGIGLLSKLYMATLGLGILLYILIVAPAWLRRLEPYLAVVLALVVILPVIYWNVVHDWAFVRFLVYERSETGAPPGHGSIERLVTQHLALVVVLLPAFLWALWASWRRRRDARFAFLFWTAVPTVVLPFLVA
ncbi:MAG: glycosyltransferase family 39 protein, partial [Armatimonadetes bacterium]|nr:glycosyltransferase family 39 protein [Armatimonadota bacterium]